MNRLKINSDDLNGISNYYKELSNMQNEIKKHPLGVDIYIRIFNSIEALNELEKKVLYNLIKLIDGKEKEILGYINFMKLNYKDGIELNEKNISNISHLRESLKILIKEKLLLLDDKEKTILIPEIVVVNKELLLKEDI